MERLKNIVICDVLGAGNIYSPKGRYEQMTKRICYGMSFCKEGQITYIHNGKEFVSDNKHVVILPEGQSYTIVGDKAGVFPVINFTCAGKLTDEFLLFPTDEMDSLMNDFEMIRKLILFPENRARIMSIFYGMISDLVNEDSFCATIAPAVQYIRKNYKDRDITNEMLAKECNVSEVYLRKLFIKYLKTTPKQYLQNIRLQRAKQLLSEGRSKMSSVSEECGFQSSYNFSRFFKDKTGLTPTEYASVKGYRP